MVQIPPRQNPYETAFLLAMEKLRQEPVDDSKLEPLGIKKIESRFVVQSLGQILVIDPKKGTVEIEGLGFARRPISVLSLHYLLSKGNPGDSRQVSFADFPNGRSYYSVFRNRIVQRFLMTSGREEKFFCAAAQRLRATHVSEFDESSKKSDPLQNQILKITPNGDTMCGWIFQVLPKIPITIIRYRGDEEFPADANVLYQADANGILAIEDLVVAAEFLLDCLDGKPIWMNP